MDGLIPFALVTVSATIAFVITLYWWRTARQRRWLKQQLASGKWTIETCPRCQGRGRCPQCGGMGTLGLMGKPCPSCGGGERIEGGRMVTMRGTGRCAQCGGHGSVYCDQASGRAIRLDEEDIG